MHVGGYVSDHVGDHGGSGVSDPDPVREQESRQTSGALSDAHHSKRLTFWRAVRQVAVQQVAVQQMAV